MSLKESKENNYSCISVVLPPYCFYASSASAATAVLKTEIRTELKSLKNRNLRRLAQRVMAIIPVYSWRTLMMNKTLLMELIN